MPALVEQLMSAIPVHYLLSVYFISSYFCQKAMRQLKSLLMKGLKYAVAGHQVVLFIARCAVTVPVTASTHADNYS
jgi:hypothetical protein